MCGDTGGKQVSMSPEVLSEAERIQLETIIRENKDPDAVAAAMQKLGNNKPNAPGSSGWAKAKASATGATSDLTDKALRDARNAEFARNRAKRGRKSQFLTDTGWNDPVGALTSAGAGPTDVKPGY